MPVLRDIGRLATCRDEGGQGDLHAVEDAALAWSGGTVTWVGPEAELPARFASEPSESAGGRLVVPGLVDCHTHLSFGGWRAGEFAARLGGASYAEIARAGGGIASTVRDTRAIAEDDLYTRCRGFLDEMVRLGVTTVEAKSGYGLNREDELKQLRVHRRLDRAHPVRVLSTFLGAHAVPPEHADDREGYLRLLTEELIPRVAAEGLASACDVFVESIAWRPDEARRVLEAARDHGLARRLHVDQLEDDGGARLAAEVGALSADHLEHVSDDGIEALAEAGVVAVDLPLASLWLGQDPMPARRLVDRGVPVAVATNFNPGSAPSFHLPLAMTLACVREGLTPAEALKGATIYGARAAGIADRAGSLEPGKAADFAVIDAPDPSLWLYHFRANACVRTTVGGETAWEAS